ncbi:MAG: hypothetical protein KDC78_01460 [Aequorivita sp.]|nr:hypothetical protein [Aequorivita sp.]
MKKLNILITFLSIAILAVSCETYDDYNTERKTVAGFNLPTKNINNIPEGGSKSSTIDIFVSDLSTVDRTFTIEDMVSTSDEFPATAPDNYTFDSTVVVPAGERFGTITVTGEDNSITDERSYFILKVQASTDVVSGGTVLVGLRN